MAKGRLYGFIGFALFLWLVAPVQAQLKATGSPDYVQHMEGMITDIQEADPVLAQMVTDLKGSGISVTIHDCPPLTQCCKLIRLFQGRSTYPLSFLPCVARPYPLPVRAAQHGTLRFLRMHMGNEPLARSGIPRDCSI